ncbi:hypothetical protein EDC94DRAFT_605249 [Helicostylum pulchrum]|nr:hypothetical protein EDC94DRAFT_605249 [Helicostylum pulchrum]
MIALSSLLTSVLLFIHLVQADTPNASSLGLNATWTAPMPSTPVSSAYDYIVSNWYSSQGFYGTSNIEFVQDPITANNSSSTVLQVKYPAGSYAPVGTKNGNTGVKGGTEFYTDPYPGVSYNTALLSYDIAFDASFDWVKGGKLPGLYGGPLGEGCSGGEKANGNNCFSVRLMWRKNGAGEAYAYIPTSERLCSTKQVTCNSDYGTSFSRGIIRFKKQQWTHLDMFIRLNTGSESNGILQVWQDGSLKINQRHIQFRANDSVGISNTMFSTFFGGGSVDYATPIDTSSYFKNYVLSVGDTSDPPPDDGSTDSSASTFTLTTISYLSVITVTFFFFFL